MILYSHSYNSIDKSEPERKRYAPYVSLCNEALSKLEGVSLDFLRPCSDLEIRLNVNDRVIKSQIGVDIPDILRKPDVVLTSKHVCSRLCLSDHTGQPPESVFQWAQVLRSDEFKTSGRKQSEEARAAVQQSFQFKPSQMPLPPDQEALTIPELEPTQGELNMGEGEALSLTLAETIGNSSSGSQVKRKRVAALSSRSSKRPRVDDSVNVEPEVPGGVQVATYALEALANRGVQYVFNYLFKGTSP